MCSLLSPSFGAHLDCPPRPTEVAVRLSGEMLEPVSHECYTPANTHAQTLEIDVSFVHLCTL